MRILPGALWVAYNIAHPAAIQSMLPAHLRLTSRPLLEDGVPSGEEAALPPQLLFNVYRVRAPYMDGSRVDIQTLAHDPASDTIHLVILDVLTNTMGWNPVDGLQRRPNGDLRWNTSADGHVEMAARRVDNESAVLEVGGVAGEPLPITHEFAVDANRRCYFGAHPIGYPMTFSEQNVMHPVRPLRAARVRNTLWSEYREDAPSHVFAHEQGMDFDVQVPWRQIIANAWRPGV